MRLISTLDPSKLTFESFPDKDGKIPKYTILSHTWSKIASEEVLYAEMLNQTDEIQSRPGFTKIQKCAEISKKLGYEWTWVDTCCIDKTNPAELSESINSMYAWYHKSALCIAFLEDFEGDSVDSATAENKWFTRGWTLQELIAPKEVIFYSKVWNSKEWKKIGDKKQNAQAVEKITSVDSKVLLSRDLENVSVAEKMKWASNRDTTKVEDMSYCLFGIFGVHLATIYGEGDNAFRRLQEEIIRNIDDVTIFLWKEEGTPNPFAHRGALARNPKEFGESRAPRTPLCILPDPFSSTNKGIMMTTELYPLQESCCKGNFGLNNADVRADIQRETVFALRFHEDKPSQHPNSSNTILLKRLLNTTGQYQYCRVHPGHLFQTDFSNWSNNPKQPVIISERLPLSNFAAKLVCKRFEVALSGEELAHKIEVSHSDASPRGLKAAFLSKDFPSLRQETTGCLVLNFYEPDNLLRAYFSDAMALERAQEKAQERKARDEYALSELAKMAKSRKAKDLFIDDVSFRLNQETRYSHKVGGRQIFFDFSRRHKKEGVLLHVEVSVVESSH